jgi:Protein of unknown function (DUF2934)
VLPHSFYVLLLNSKEHFKMAKAKSPRPTTKTGKQVITMPEAGSVPIKKSAASPSSPPGSSVHELESKIRHRAYELYVERGQITGRDQEDWFQAELEILASVDNHKQSA